MKLLSFVLSSAVLLTATAAQAQDAPLDSVAYTPPLVAYDPAGSTMALVPRVSAAPQKDGPAMERRSTALMVTGIVLSSFGAAAMVTGAALVVHGEDQSDDFDATCARIARSGTSVLGCGMDFSGLYTIAGWSALAGGVAFLGAGVPMTIVGASKVPSKNQTASLRPTVRLAPAAVSFTWRM